MPKPVFIGDTLRAETEVVGLKDSNSRPEAGIVTFEHRMYNQRDELVCVMERTALMQRRRGRDEELRSPARSCPATGRTGWRRRWPAAPTR